LLPGNGNILELHLSLPATQINPILYNYIQNYQNVLSGDTFTGTHMSAESGRPEIDSLFRGIGNIIESRRGGILSRSGNIAQHAISDVLPEINALVAASVNVEKGNIERPDEGTLIPATLNCFGPVDGGLSAIIGDITKSGLSLQAAQPVSAFYKTIRHSPIVMPTDQGTKTVASEHSRMLSETADKFTPEYGFIFNGIGKVAHSVTGCLLRGNGNTVVRENCSPFPGTEYVFGHWMVICCLEL
jgi:hypothetical protein